MKLTRFTATRIAALAFAAPLALALTACGDKDATDGGDLAGEPIAAIPAPEGKAWTDVVTVTDQQGYLLGNPDAPIKLVEYASHTCSHCAEFAAAAKDELTEKYIATGVVAFEQREMIRGFEDLLIATLVQCGPKESVQPLSDQGWAALNDIFAGIQGNAAAYQAAGTLPPEKRFVAAAEAGGLIDFFSSRGVSADQARACLADTKKIEAIAKASDAQAKEFGITGTPTFMLNGTKLEENTWDALEPMLQRAGARTK
jgi:protein-disulfide isomerase